MMPYGRTCFLVIFIGVLSVSASIAQPKVLFVSPTGNNQNSGLSIDLPLQSINTALQSTSAGDTIYLLAGTFREVVQFIGKNGAAEQPIRIYGYSKLPGQRPVIDGGASTPSNSATKFWMTITNSQWIEIANVEFRNGWTDPIQVYNSSYLTFNQCYFYGGRRVITASGSTTHHVLVENCYWDQGGSFLWNLVTDSTGVDAWTSMHEGAMQYYNGSLVNFHGTGGSFVIRHNTIVNAFNGIRWSAVKGCDSNVEVYDNSVTNIRDNDFEPEYFTFNLHIYHNQSHNIHKTMSVDNVEGGYIYYYGNRVTSDGDAWSNTICTAFWKVYGSTNFLTDPMVAFNNSFCGVGKAFGSMGGKAVQLKHFNNAYYFTGSRGWNLEYWDSTNVFDFDISNKSWALNLTSNNQEQNGKISNTIFADPQKFDLRLQSSSPAIDAGAVMSFPELGWTQSYRGAAPDIGAFEGDSLVEGPPFRFRTSSDVSVSYLEKPRIVRSKVRGNSLELFFSAPLNPESVSSSSLLLSEGQSNVTVVGVTLLDDNYRMVVETSSELQADALNLRFTRMPKGANGEDATLWGADLNYSRAVLLTGLVSQGKELHDSVLPSLKIFPNPFNPSTTIQYSLSRHSRVRVSVFSLTGQEVRLLAEEDQDASNHRLVWNGKDNAGKPVSSGVYFCRVVAQPQGGNAKSLVLAKKVLLIK